MSLAEIIEEERVQLRLEPAIVDMDGVICLVLNGQANDNGLKSKFDPHLVVGYDDGDPHYLTMGS